MVLKKKDFCRIAQKHAKRTTEKFRVNFSVVLLNNSSGNPTINSTIAASVTNPTNYYFIVLQATNSTPLPARFSLMTSPIFTGAATSIS